MIKKLGSKFDYFAGISIIALLVITVLSRTGNNEDKLQGKETTCENEPNKNVIGSNYSNQECDLFSGKWVYDGKSHPLYRDRHCSFVLDDYACEKYGRRDLKYQKWRWQPHGCDLPRFNGRALLEKIRGKKIIFVGDSLNKNQWNSMLCLIESSLSPSENKTLIRDGNLIFFQSTEYNATIGFYWSPFLVESNNDHPIIHRPDERIVRIEAIEKHAKHWNDADILIFNTYIWWTHPIITLLWGSFRSPDAIYKPVEMKFRRYEMALNTWSNWLEININRTKTKLFFMSLSPIHQWGEAWSIKQHCYNQHDPIFKQGYWGISTDRDMMHVAESTIRGLEARGLKVEYINITHLSDYRKDAHPSIYRKFMHTITKDQLRDPKSYADCLHWCLPGLPDTWNEILYAYLIKSS